MRWISIAMTVFGTDEEVTEQKKLLISWLDL